MQHSKTAVILNILYISYFTKTAVKCNICIGMMNILSKKVINLLILFKLSNLKAIEGLCNLPLSMLVCIKVATSKFIVTSISVISSILNLFPMAYSSCSKKINQEPTLSQRHKTPRNLKTKRCKPHKKLTEQ